MSSPIRLAVWTLPLRPLLVPSASDMCVTGGNCGANARCINHVDAPPTCKCGEGFTGNYDQPGVDCHGELDTRVLLALGPDQLLFGFLPVTPGDGAGRIASPDAHRVHQRAREHCNCPLSR